jgi:hypothetical protein
MTVIDLHAGLFRLGLLFLRSWLFMFFVCHDKSS